MTRTQIENKLKNPLLSDLERESLNQLLHYLHVEGITHASSNKPKPKYTKKKRSN